ncbi:hypothetical protein ACF0H5_017591 [Mactra antiquata]
MNIYISFSWTDCFIPCLKEWNTTTLKKLPLDASMVWIPDIRFGTRGHYGTIPNDAYGKIHVYRNGTIKGWPYIYRTVPIAPNIHYFPFDTQTIRIELYTWTENVDELLLIHENEHNPLVAYEENSEWEMVKHSGNSDKDMINTNYEWSSIKFEFVIRRKWLYPAISMILPVVLTSILNCLVFVLPVESGERITLNISVFLTLAVFLTIINDSLPRNSNGVSILVLYLLLQMVGTVLSIAFTCLVVNLYFTKNCDRPTLQHRVLSKVCCTGLEVEVDVLELPTMQKDEKKRRDHFERKNTDHQSLSKKFDILLFWMSVTWNIALLGMIIVTIVTRE